MGADELGFDGQVAIVTGAGGGLGREHALLMASRGALVVVNDLGGAVDGTGSDQGAAAKVVAEITDAGGEAVADTSSVATVEGGRAIVQSALDAFGRVDILVNNAGILRDKAFHNMTEEQVQGVLDVHLKGAFNVTSAAWGHMRERGYGRVICTSSAAGLFGNFGQANYGAAKMGLVGLTKVLAVEGAKYHIKANAIAPFAKTRMTEDLLGGFGDAVGPELVAPLVTYLAHESCEPTGRVFSAGGGRIAEVFVGETAGWGSRELSPEDVRDHFAEITDLDGYTVPAAIADETGLFVSFLKESGAG